MRLPAYDGFVSAGEKGSEESATVFGRGFGKAEIAERKDAGEGPPAIALAGKRAERTPTMGDGVTMAVDCN